MPKALSGRSGFGRAALIRRSESPRPGQAARRRRRRPTSTNAAPAPTNAAPAAASGTVALEPVKAGWLKFSPRTDAEAGATAGSAGALADGNTAGGVEAAGGTEEAGADDAGADDGGTEKGGTDEGGTDEGGSVIGYCVCAPAWFAPPNTVRPATRRKANRNRDLFTPTFSHSVVDCATVNLRSCPPGRKFAHPGPRVSAISFSGDVGRAIDSEDEIPRGTVSCTAAQR